MPLIPTTRSRRIAAALAAATATMMLAATPAHATGATDAVCTERFNVTITPGFGLTPSSGTVSTGGETGSVSCVGKLDGHRITGNGSIGFDEQYTGNCTSDASTGTLRATIPTTAGRQQLVGTFTQRRTALVFTVDVRFPSSRYHGIGVVIPTQGTCLLTPLRQAALLVTGPLRGPS